MRTFHTGGIASGDDITQGLPRVEELFEARKPKRDAILTEISGRVSLGENKKKREVTVTSEDDPSETKVYQINYGSRLKVQDGQHVEAARADRRLHQPPRPAAHSGREGRAGLPAARGFERVPPAGLNISDKHIEIIVKQMLRKVRVRTAATRCFCPLPRDIYRFEERNRQTIEAGGRPAIAKRVLLGITKASLATESFLSAASFQETTRVLTDAAIKGKVDPLLGLKENVIIGKLIPAGTGMRRYKDIELVENF